jgi:hypothetical protein
LVLIFAPPFQTIKKSSSSKSSLFKGENTETIFQPLFVLVKTHNNEKKCVLKKEFSHCGDENWKIRELVFHQYQKNEIEIM